MLQSSFSGLNWIGAEKHKLIWLIGKLGIKGIPAGTTFFRGDTILVWTGQEFTIVGRSA